MDPTSKGYFIHATQGEGYDCCPSRVERGHWPFPWREKQIYLFTLAEDHPLTFIQDNGTQIRPGYPGESYETDLGSIPPAMQGVVRKEGVEYFFHDYGYKHGFLWIKESDATMFSAVPLRRSDVDRLLRTMSQCSPMDPRGVGKSTMIWAAVRAFGWACGYQRATGTLPDPYPAKPEWEKPDSDDTGSYGGGG